MRMTYMGETRINPKALPPLLFAGIIFEGGIIGFDSNIQTGGVGARLLGIGGDLKYRLDTITIYLRAVSTKTGQVVGSVTTHKTIASVGLQGGVFKYIAIDKILEAEAGFTKNEPEQLAVQQAIEKAVYAMLIEGADTDVWSFADAATQARLVQEYRAQQYDASRWASGDDRLAKTARIAAPRAEATGSVPAARESGGASPAAIAVKPAAAPGASPPLPARTVKLPSRKPSASALKPASAGASKDSTGSIRPSRPSNRGWAAAPVPVKERF
jgi:curli production assembly/transport component CsgG